MNATSTCLHSPMSIVAIGSFMLIDLDGSTTLWIFELRVCMLGYV